MRAVIQRVTQAQVSVENEVVGQIERGLLVLLGVAQEDTDSDLEYMVNKVAGLRVFEDQQAKMNLDVKSVGGSVLVVSQFTLFGDVRRGKRPSFTEAASPPIADMLYQKFCNRIELLDIPVQRGIFQADMKVSLINDGPVTILLDSRKIF